VPHLGSRPVYLAAGDLWPGCLSRDTRTQRLEPSSGPDYKLVAGGISSENAGTPPESYRSRPPPAPDRETGAEAAPDAAVLGAATEAEPDDEATVPEYPEDVVPMVR